MNQSGGLQLTFPAQSENVLTIAFKGESTREDIELFKKAIDVRLNPNAKP